MSEDLRIAEHNRRILERRQGVPARTMTRLEAMMDPTCPIRCEQNDNQPDPRKEPPADEAGVSVTRKTHPSTNPIAGILNPAQISYTRSRR